MSDPKELNASISEGSISSGPVLPPQGLTIPMPAFRKGAWISLPYRGPNSFCTREADLTYGQLYKLAMSEFERRDKISPDSMMDLNAHVELTNLRPKGFRKSTLLGCLRHLCLAGYLKWDGTLSSVSKHPIYMPVSTEWPTLQPITNDGSPQEEIVPIYSAKSKSKKRSSSSKLLDPNASDFQFFDNTPPAVQKKSRNFQDLSRSSGFLNFSVVDKKNVNGITKWLVVESRENLEDPEKPHTRKFWKTLISLEPQSPDFEPIFNAMRAYEFSQFELEEEEMGSVTPQHKPLYSNGLQQVLNQMHSSSSLQLHSTTEHSGNPHEPTSVQSQGLSSDQAGLDFNQDLNKLHHN